MADPKRVRSIFLEAVEHHAREQWKPFLDRVCGEDQELCKRVEELLSAHEQANSMLDVATAPPAASVDPSMTEGPGTLIGPYKLLEQIGEGGFGIVFMAEQQHPVRRKVALKVLKPGMDTRQVVARFEAERQALALMEHDNIARVLDAGETPTGRPYFAMELVRGIPITQFCDESRLTPRQRLELFVTVCQAVQHAHQKGIIHRDLKPSNVLVTLHDGTPVAKVIDFGIAKAIGPQLTDKTLVTGFAQMIGTPLYMSPEQTAISALDVDTRSDIYSLGVLLYELLTGTTPFDKERFKEAGYDEMRRIIREEEPPKPSTRISTLGQAATTLSANRQTDPGRLSKLFRGELDWIVMKALEKDRNRRYETASAFAADVQRFFHDEPVAACPPSAWYRFRKFARRNKAALVMVALVLLVLMTMGGSIGWTLRDRSVRRAAVDTEAARSLADAQQLQDEGKYTQALTAVKRADGWLAAGSNEELRAQVQDLRKDLEMVIRLDEIRLQRAAVGSDGSPFDDPGVDRRYVQAFRDYGIDLAALPREEAANRIRKLTIRSELAVALDEWSFVRRHGRLSNDAAWRELLALAEEIDPDGWRNQFRSALQSSESDHTALARLARSEGLLHQPTPNLVRLAIALRKAELSKESLSLLQSAQRQRPADFWINFELGYAYAHAIPPDWDESLRYYSVAFALRPDSAVVLTNLGLALRNKGRNEEAIAAYRAAMSLQTRDAAPYNNLGHVLHEKGEVAAAIVAYSKAIELEPDLARPWSNRGSAYRHLGQLDKALADCSKAIELRPDVADYWNNRGNAYVELAQPDKALTDLSKAIELKADHAPAWHNRGRAYLALNQAEKAVADFSTAIELDPRLPGVWYDRGVAHGKLKLWDKAVADYTKAIELKPDYAFAWCNRGSVYSDLGQQDKALADCSKAIELAPDDSLAWHNRGKAYLLLGQPAKAVADYSKAIELKPAAAETWSNRGNAYFTLGDPAKGIADFSRAIELQPDFAPAWCNRGIVRGKLGQVDQAVADLSQAIKLQPNYTSAWANRAITYSKMGQHENARADLSKTIDLEKDPNKVAALHTLRARENERVGRPQDALQDYRKVKELSPRSAMAHNRLAWFLSNCSEAKLRAPTEAVELAKQAIKLAPQDGLYWNTLGVAQFRAGDCKVAIEALDKSRQLRGGGDSFDFFFLAMACWQLGEKKQAENWYSQAVQWMEKNKPQDEELGRLRAEAETLLNKRT